MAVKLVVDSDAVMERMALADIDGREESIDSALITAHLHYQSVFSSSFEKREYGDIFYLEPTLFPTAINGLLRLRLSNGFVDESTIHIKAGPDIGFMETTNDYRVNAERGIVFLPESKIGNYVSIEYTAGFSEAVRPPEWLKEAILSFVPTVLNNQQTTNRKDAAKPLSDQARNLSAPIIESRLRSIAFCYRPIS